MTPEEANREKAPKKQSQKKPISGLLPIFALIISIIALLGVIYTGLFSEKANLMRGSSKQFSQLQLKNQGLMQSVTQLKSAIAALQNKVKDNQLAVTKIVGYANNGQQRWLFAEADYLLKMANITLQFRHNVPVTIALLKSADRRLFEIGDPKLYPVREIIANNVTELGALPKLDVVGIYLHLQALRLQAKNLPLATNRFVNVDSKNLLEQYQPEESGAWHTALHATSQALGKFLC